MDRLVIFDIDGTLVPGASSEVRFARYLWRNGKLGPRQVLAFVGFVLCHWLRFPRSVLQKNKAYLSGLSVDTVDDCAREFVSDELMQILYAPILLRLRAHQAAGEQVVLLSGTPEFIASALARALDVHAFVGAVCDSEDGKYTAQPPRTHPHGESKINAARKLATQADLPLSEAIAYGDSVHDAWLFRAVGQSIAVMPDRGLRAAAAREGWEIFG